MQVIEAVVFNQLDGFVGILFAEGGQQIGHDHVNVLLLVARKFAYGNALQLSSLESDCVCAMLSPRIAQQSQFSLLAIQHLENFVRPLGLVPINVAGMIGCFVVAQGGVPVENRAAEGRAFN